MELQRRDLLLSLGTAGGIFLLDRVGFALAQGADQLIPWSDQPPPVPPRAEAFSGHTLARSEQRSATFCEESCSCSTAGMLREGRLVRGVYFRWPVPSYQGLRCHSAMFQVSESHGVAL